MKDTKASLIKRKQEATELLAKWQEVYDYVSKHPESKVGDSIVGNALKLVKERDQYFPLIAKAAEAMGFIRFAAICWKLNGPQWSEEPGFSQKMTNALLKRESQIVDLMTKNQELVDALMKRLHKVDDYHSSHYVGCEGEPCVCEGCAEIKNLVKKNLP